MQPTEENKFRLKIVVLLIGSAGFGFWQESLGAAVFMIVVLWSYWVKDS